MPVENLLFSFVQKALVGAGLVFSALIGTVAPTAAPTQSAPPAVEYRQAIDQATATPGTAAGERRTTKKTAGLNPAARLKASLLGAASTSPAASRQPEPLPPAPSLSPAVLNDQTRASVVNILCTTGAGGYFNPISGSGTIIDSRGIILTNAHVAQYFLLRNYPTPGNVNCVIRTGSPARAAYTAVLLYLPPAWIDANASQITSAHPTGTGENDFALLRITGTTDPNASLPTTFPYLALSIAPPMIGDSMLLASYPAGFLDGSDIQRDLYLSSAYATVAQLFVFSAKDQWVDIFSVPGSVVSQGGSSGGAVVRASDGALAGIIVTSTDATTTAARDLRALSIAHIEHSLESAGTGGLDAILNQQDIITESENFNDRVAPTLTQKLIDAINAH